MFEKVKKLNLDNYEEILKGNIDDLFIKYSNFKSEEKKEFKKEEESLLNKENENKIYKIKLLNLIFSKTIEEIFKMYLNDDKHIAYGETKLFLEEFKTFIDDFNEYISKQWQNIKKCINLLVGCKLANLPEDNIEKSQKTQPTKINHYNSRRSIIVSALKSFYISLKEFVNFNYKIDLSQPSYKKDIEHNVKKYLEFMNYYLKYIFTNLVQKKSNPEKNYSQLINDILQKEEKEEKEENRKLNKLLNSVHILNIVKAFLNDQKKINIKEETGNEIEFYFINFNTYKDCFIHLSKDTKDNYKNDFENLLEGKINSREKSEKRNLSLKNNQNLRKKRKRS